MSIFDTALVTYTLMALTAAISLLALNNAGMAQRLMFNPWAVQNRGEWHRFITHAFVHADFLHLFVNMWVLWNFGPSTEQFFVAYIGPAGRLVYLFLYVGGVLFSSLPSFGRHKQNPNYNSVGASGAVAAVLFSAIYFTPTVGIGILFIPFPIPAFVFGGLYLALEYYLDKRGGDHVAHDAHFWGAVFGFCFSVIMVLKHLPIFIDEIKFYLHYIL